MGVSTDALLVYGYVWEDEHNLFAGPVDDEDDSSDEEETGSPEWPEVIAKRRGIPRSVGWLPGP